MSTVSSSMATVKRKDSTPAKDNSNVENCAKITLDLLRYFPFLQMAPDVMYWLMATWGAESNWRLLHKKKDGTYNSLHHTVCNPDNSSLIGRGYQYSNVISNLWNASTTTAQTRDYIKEGWYAHGISACMGTYHVRGCPNNMKEWRKYPEAVTVINSFGLEVDPGQSISQTLFPTDDDTCRTRSIAAGMIIFNAKYRTALETNKKNDPTGAMQMAIGNFLGKFGQADANGTTPEMRIAQLSSTKSDVVLTLHDVGIVPTGQRGELSTYLIDMANRQAKDRAANKVTTTAATGATTNGGSAGVSAARPGCALS